MKPTRKTEAVRRYNDKRKKPNWNEEWLGELLTVCDDYRTELAPVRKKIESIREVMEAVPRLFSVID